MLSHLFIFCTCISFVRYLDYNHTAINATCQTHRPPTSQIPTPLLPLKNECAILYILPLPGGLLPHPPGNSPPYQRSTLEDNSSTGRNQYSGQSDYSVDTVNTSAILAEISLILSNNGFTFVSNSTFLPTALVQARQYRQKQDVYRHPRRTYNSIRHKDRSHSPRRFPPHQAEQHSGQRRVE